MSYFPDILITPKISPAVDAFQRLRVSEIVRQFSAMAEYTDNPLIWETKFVGTGSSTYIANGCAVRVSTGGTANLAQATRQTRRYMRYMPGKSLLILQTFVMSAAQTNTTVEIGYNDGNNGILFQRVGSVLNFVQRSFVSGAAIDTTVAQASWNLDTLNGSGRSGVTLDPTKTQILVIDLQFLGVGRVRVGFDFGGSIGVVYCHQFTNQNSITTPYMSSACLPVRGNVFNTGTAGGIVTLDMICTAVANEGAPAGAAGVGGGGGFDSERIFHWSAPSAAAGVAVNATLLPLVTIRAATKLGGSGGTVTNRGHIIPATFSVYNRDTGASIYYEAWINATLTGPSFTANNANSLAEIDTAATVINTTNAYRVAAGFLAPRAGTSVGITDFSDFPLVYTGLNSVQDQITIAAIALTGGPGTVNASIDWDEQY